MEDIAIEKGPDDARPPEPEPAKLAQPPQAPGIDEKLDAILAALGVNPKTLKEEK